MISRRGVFLLLSTTGRVIAFILWLVGTVRSLRRPSAAPGDSEENGLEGDGR